MLFVYVDAKGFKLMKICSLQWLSRYFCLVVAGQYVCLLFITDDLKRQIKLLF